jgi:uncharacterized membrane protein
VSSRDTRDILGGVLLTLAGLFFALYARQYGFGSAARMGPGYFPTVLGWMLAVLGLLIALPALRRQGDPLQVRWKSLVAVIAGVLFFAFSLPHVGLVIAVSGTVILTSLADDDLTWRGRIVLAIVVPILMALIFVWALGMILPLFWW